MVDVLPEKECELLANELSALHQRRREAAKSRLGGVRNLLRILPQVADLAHSPRLQIILNEKLHRTAFPVRALFFDKTVEANWHVAWHQDLTIAVVEKIETPEYIAWSVKEGSVHVQPERRVLEGMAAIRLHLDACNASNGALKVLPGSHLHGKLDAAAIKKWTHETNPFVCEIPKGGALLMRPLLLHSSAPSQNPAHRRVVHIEYATEELPNGLKWFDC